MNSKPVNMDERVLVFRPNRATDGNPTHMTLERTHDELVGRLEVYDEPQTHKWDFINKHWEKVTW